MLAKMEYQYLKDVITSEIRLMKVNNEMATTKSVMRNVAKRDGEIEGLVRDAFLWSLTEDVRYLETHAMPKQPEGIEY